MPLFLQDGSSPPARGEAGHTPEGAAMPLFLQDQLSPAAGQPPGQTAPTAVASRATDRPAPAPAVGTGRGTTVGDRGQPGRAGSEGGRRAREQAAPMVRQLDMPPAGPAPTPAGETEFQSLVDAEVSAYLEGNVSEDRLQAISAASAPLLQSADALGQREVTESEGGSVLGNLTGITPLVQAFTRKAPAGYEHEEPWLRTVARVRDIAQAIGGVVGTIGLIATVSGFILSVLIPPVGAFLLTVGRFCDLIALVLDVVGLALNVFLTAYNLYRLKHATNPDEKRRLLGLVRQDAMNTLLSGVAVATAVAPGAARWLSKTRVGRATGNALGRAIEWAGRTRAGRGLGALGRGLTGGARDAAAWIGRSRVGRRVAALGASAAAGVESGLVRLRGTAPIRWANRVSGELEERARGYFRGLASRNTRLGRFYNRSIRGFHERNIRVAEMINNPIERQYQLRLGRQMTDRLEDLQRQGVVNINALGQRIEDEFGVRRYQRGAGGHFDLRTDTMGQIIFARQDSDVLARVRSAEFTELRLIRERNPAPSLTGLAPADATAQQRAYFDRLAREVNGDPFIKGRWTPDELRALDTLNPTSLPKTPHHMIPAQMAPAIHRDPRFMQIVNDQRSYQDFVTAAFPGYADLPDRVRVAGARPGSTRWSRTRDELTEGMRNAGQLTVPSNDFFTSEQFLRELRDQGSTGAWINPRATNQRFMFNPHLVIGHNWDWQLEVARDIFDLNARLGTRGEAFRQLLEPAARQALREGRQPDTPPPPGPTSLPILDRALGVRPTAAQSGESVLGVPAPAVTAAATVTPANAAQAGIPPTTRPSGGNSGAFVAELAGRLSRPIVSFGATPTMPAAAHQASTALIPNGPELRRAEPPTAPILYSPSSLREIRGWRVAVAAAIEAVQGFLQATVESQQTNAQALRTTRQLDERSDTQQQLVEGEQHDVAQQQGNLQQARGAQERMSGEGQRASSQTDRGKQEGESVKSEGENVQVEAKPEEPRERSWLERAWDATAGWAWHHLVDPIVRAVKRKVQQIMTRITNFMMRIISQALGLDEIEAQINAGGSDIQGRQSSLAQTDAGLQQTHTEAQQAQQRNERTAAQAESNLEDAEVVRADAEALLEGLLAQQQLLEQEEALATAYIAGFGSRYADFFEQEKVTAAAEPNATTVATTSEPAAEQLPADYLLAIDAHVNTLRNAEDYAQGELKGVVDASGASIAPALRDTEQQATRQASDDFLTGRQVRLATLDHLLFQARTYAALPGDQGITGLEAIAQQLATLGGQLEQERAAALQLVYDVHVQAQVEAPSTPT
jgi:hypothetical protein